MLVIVPRFPAQSTALGLSLAVLLEMRVVRVDS
jgi:hypothetical protein